MIYEDWLQKPSTKKAIKIFKQDLIWFEKEIKKDLKNLQYKLDL